MEKGCGRGAWMPSVSSSDDANDGYLRAAAAAAAVCVWAADRLESVAEVGDGDADGVESRCWWWW